MKKILIVKPSSLGDVVHGMRVVRQIKIAFPESEIHWVIKKGLEGILDAVGWVDRYFIFERDSIHIREGTCGARQGTGKANRAATTVSSTTC